MRSPIFAGAALLLTGAAFAAIIAASYPDSEEADVPVVKAETTAARIAPEQPGGMSVPFEDSTIFSTVRSSELEESPPIENLLEEEEPVDKLEAFAQEVEAQMNTSGDLEKTATGQTEASASEAPAEEETAADETAASTEETTAAASMGGDPNVKIITMETEKIPPSAEPVKKTASAASVPAKPPMHAAASSPETLEYVRSVLEKKDAQKALNAAPTTPPSAAAMAAIEPAAGSTMAAPIEPGNWYVQLASVTSATGAESEWGKLQKSFGYLSGMDYRVQQADLGERGIYYRVQAGPMSKESAASLCESIKSEKPGGCLVVQ